MFPRKNKRRALQLETSAAEAEPRELRESASFQMKQLLGHIREERQNRADGKRKRQGYQLTTKGWAHFHCKLFFFLNFISLFSSPFSSNVLAVHLSLSGELIVASMGDCWHEENTVIKVRKAVVRLASPFWRNQELHQKIVLLQSKLHSS